MKNTPPAVAWHYTTALGFLALLRDGQVNVSAQDIGPNERPVAWFSANPVMEFTIREVAIERPDGTFLRSKSPADYRIMGSGLYRVAASKQGMLRYVDLLRTAKIGQTRRRKLESAARMVGASPFEWYGRLEPLSLDEALGLEMFDGTRWKPLQREGASKRVMAELDVTKDLLVAMIASKRADKVPSSATRLI